MKEKAKKVEKHAPEVVETIKKISNNLIDENKDFSLSKERQNRQTISVGYKWVIVTKKNVELWESTQKYYGYDDDDAPTCLKESTTKDVDVAVQWLLAPYYK